jgi:hypothetical protein
MKGQKWYGLVEIHKRYAEVLNKYAATGERQ